MSSPSGLPRLPGLIEAFNTTFKKEIIIGFRNRGDLANPLIFFLCIIVFVPLGISPDGKVLVGLAPGMIWIVALLATLLSLDRIFQSDFEDGSLEQMIVSGQSLYWMVIAKVLVHWFMTGLPLTLLAPLLGVMMSLPEEGYLPLMVSLFLGTGSLSLIGSIGAALTVALRRGGLLLSLIIMPLYVPVLIFGSAVVRNAIDNSPIVGQTAILGAFLILSLVLAPLAAAGALKISING
ncbi:heme exporter protein CcmB [Agarilytica rhodophyticola]|uniref:heme exporter protein CcmB n=1 Tax=Agarilytica rhodophyticola TaxID=1737490 RepID=UPI000B3437D1|nr:heme exporter protein CcmB [Agarilytica rhodophyticola]